MKKFKIHSSLTRPALIAPLFLICLQVLRGNQENFFRKLSIYVGHKFQRNRNFMWDINSRWEIVLYPLCFLTEETQK